MDAAPRPLPDAERLAWLRLIRTEHIGPVTFFRLLERYGSAAAALEAVPRLSARGGGGAMTPASRAAAEAEIEGLAAIGGRLIARDESDYPEALGHIGDPPPLIAVRGDPALLRRRCVAVVGARNASLNGRRLADMFAAELGAAGIVVVSGLARGIDGAAHTAALAAGANGAGTVAVLAGGVDVVYPAEHARLYAEIVARGAVVSEQPLGTEPTAGHFPPRNRLIAGLSLGVVVVEATPKSGSLITARLAAEQGREVFAVPGSPLDPRSRGCNDLIRNGAVLTESIADILAALPSAKGFERPRQGEHPWQKSYDISNDYEVDEARQRLLDLLGPAAVTVDEIVRECQMSPASVQTALLELELAGRIERQPGNRILRVA
jgi:DNA processing protein